VEIFLVQVCTSFFSS